MDLENLDVFQLRLMDDEERLLLLEEIVDSGFEDCVNEDVRKLIEIYRKNGLLNARDTITIDDCYKTFRGI